VAATTDIAARVGRLQQLRQDTGLRYRLQQSAISVLLIFVVIQVASVVFAEVDPNRFAYMTTGNLLTAFQTIPFTGVAAIGVGLLMIAGEFDLSIGANYLFSSIVMAQIFMNDHINVWLCLLIGLAVGTGIGLLNGLITLQFHIPSFITTLGTAGIWTAAMLVIHGASSQYFAPPHAFGVLFNGTFASVMGAGFVWFVLLSIGGWLLLQRHSIGNHLFAAGGGLEAARWSGVPVVRTKLIAFSLAGGLAALAGILAAVNVSDIAPDVNPQLPLQAIAACVIGGLNLTGGRGTVLGIFLGSILLYWIQDVLLLLGVSGFWLFGFIGALVIVSAVMHQALQARHA
jgi:ribose/xylose/arabinose/galactoside ABC-type transport system permease subunit